MRYELEFINLWYRAVYVHSSPQRACSLHAIYPFMNSPVQCALPFLRLPFMFRLWPKFQPPKSSMISLAIASFPCSAIMPSVSNALHSWYVRLSFQQALPIVSPIAHNRPVSFSALPHSCSTSLVRLSVSSSSSQALSRLLAMVR